MLRIRISSVYVASGMTAVVRDNPVNGSNKAKAAKRRDRVQDPGETDHNRAHRTLTRREQRKRERDRETEHQRPDRQRRVLAQARQDVVAVIADPTPVDPGVAVVGGEHVDQSEAFGTRASSRAVMGIASKRGKHGGCSSACDLLPTESEDHTWRSWRASGHTHIDDGCSSRPSSISIGAELRRPP